MLSKPLLHLPNDWSGQHLSNVDSTQCWIKDHLKKATADQWDRHVVLATQQSLGRGRLGSDWTSPPGGLWASFSLQLPGPIEPILGPLLGLSIALAIQACLKNADDSAKKLRDQDLCLKWPNDLHVNERKVGGLMAEVSNIKGHTVVIMGFGLNLALSKGALAHLPQATSIEQEFGIRLSPQAVLSRILSCFDQTLENDQNRGRSHSIAKLSEMMSTLGQNISWGDRPARGTQLPSASPTQYGRALRLDPNGALIVQTDVGERTLHAEEIQHLRPHSP